MAIGELIGHRPAPQTSSEGSSPLRAITHKVAETAKTIHREETGAVDLTPLRRALSREVRHIRASHPVKHVGHELPEREEAIEQLKRKERSVDQTGQIANLPGEQRMVYGLGERMHNPIAKELRGPTIGDWQPVTITQNEYSQKQGELQTLFDTQAVGAYSSLKDKSITVFVLPLEPSHPKQPDGKEAKIAA
jgi:hypothetical protein